MFLQIFKLLCFQNYSYKVIFCGNCIQISHIERRFLLSGFFAKECFLTRHLILKQLSKFKVINTLIKFYSQLPQNKNKSCKFKTSLNRNISFNLSIVNLFVFDSILSYNNQLLYSIFWFVDKCLFYDAKSYSAPVICSL